MAARTEIWFFAKPDFANSTRTSWFIDARTVS
jgi:hypothetical protein